MTTVIAIDGAAGSGKSTLAQRLAAELGLPYVNTGLMYRALALRAHREGVSPENAPVLERLARGMRFDLDSSVRPPELRIDGEPPDPALTSAEVESSVSAVSRHLEVREVFRREQRRLAVDGAVMEGRDIGSVVSNTIASGAGTNGLVRASSWSRVPSDRATCSGSLSR